MRSAVPQKLRSGNAARKSVMKALMSSRPFRASCSEYLSSMSGAAISSTTPRLHVLPQKSVNQRPTTALLSCSFDILISLFMVEDGEGNGLRISGRPNGKSDETELTRSGHPVGQFDFFDNFSVLEPHAAHTGEPHRPARCIGKSAHDEIIKSRPRVCAFAHPPAHDHIAFGDEIGRAFNVEIRKRFPKVRHECLERLKTNSRRVQRMVEKDVARGEFIDDGGIVVFTPEVREPPIDDRFILPLFLRRR